MIAHLGPADLVSALDGRHTEAQARHLEQCASCREGVAALRASEAELRANANVPEPSPLFWDHFAARVRRATAEEPVPAAAWWEGRGAALVAAGCAVGVIVAALVIRLPQVPNATEVSDTAGLVRVQSDDARWDDVVQMAAQLSSEDVSGAAPITETAGLLADLTSEERQAFLRLLAAEMKDGR